MTSEQLDAIPFSDGTVRPVILGGRFVGETFKVGANYTGHLAGEGGNSWHCGAFATREEAAQAVREAAIIAHFRANPNAEVWLDLMEREEVT